MTETALSSYSEAPSVSPRLFTWQGFFIALGVVFFAVAMALASLYARRTPLEKTKEFFGPDAVFAIQVGEQLRIVIPPDSPMVNAKAPHAKFLSDGSQVAIFTGSPGLSHFRNALLNERHYEWQTLQQRGVREMGVENPEYVYVEIEGRSPEAEPLPVPLDITPTKLILEMSEGWVGLEGGAQSVRMRERVRRGMYNFIDTRKDIGDHHSL